MQHLKYATSSDDESVRAHAEGTDVLLLRQEMLEEGEEWTV